MTEQENNLIKNWEFLLDNLPKANNKRYKFAKIYEKIVQNNSKDDTKMLLSIIYRVFKKLDTIKMSKGTQHSIEVGEFYNDDFYINGTIIMDQFISFCDVISEIVIEKLQIINKIGYLKIESHDGIKKINIIF
jgi:hypothetical protein